MKGPLGNIMKQAQEMQEKLKSAQESLASIEVTGASGGGMVEVVMTCRSVSYTHLTLPTICSV